MNKISPLFHWLQDKCPTQKGQLTSNGKGEKGTKEFDFGGSLQSNHPHSNPLTKRKREIEIRKEIKNNTTRKENKSDIKSQ